MDDDICCPDGMNRLLSAEFFKSLSDPVRLQVVTRLLHSSQPLTVTEIQSCCGVHLSGVSRHLAALKAAGVLAAMKTGREVRYRLLAGDLSRRLRALADAIDSVRTVVQDRGSRPGSACCDPPQAPSPEFSDSKSNPEQTLTTYLEKRPP